MSHQYVKILIDGFEESIDISWLARIVRTSTHPGDEAGTAYFMDGETRGVINNENINIVRSIRPEIIETSKLVMFCEDLGEADPFEDDKKTMEEWWEELMKA